MKSIARFITPLSCLLMLSVNSPVFSMDEDQLPEAQAAGHLPQAPQHLRADPLEEHIRVALLDAYHKALTNNSRTPRKDAKQKVLDELGAEVTRGQADYTIDRWRNEQGLPNDLADE